MADSEDKAEITSLGTREPPSLSDGRSFLPAAQVPSMLCETSPPPPRQQINKDSPVTYGVNHTPRRSRPTLLSRYAIQAPLLCGRVSGDGGRKCLEPRDLPLCYLPRAKERRSILPGSSLLPIKRLSCHSYCSGEARSRHDSPQLQKVARLALCLQPPAKSFDLQLDSRYFVGTLKCCR